MQAIDELLTNASDSLDSNKDAKILDIGAGKGQIGRFLSEKGYTEIYG